MSMQRYFAKEKTGEDITLYESDLHHIKNVMRGNVGDNIEVVDNVIYIFANVHNITEKDYAELLDILNYAHKELKQ